MKYGRRKSFRCPAQVESCDTVLRIRRRTVKVRLEDQSAGGFSVTSLANVPVKEGQQLRLRTDIGWVAVQVVYRRRESDRTRIGLQRLEEESPIRRRKKVVEWWKTNGKHRPRTGAGVALAAAFLLAGLTAWMLWQRGCDEEGQFSLDRLLHPRPVEIENNTVDPATIARWERQLVRRMGVLGQLNATKTADKLRLSDEQQTRIKAIVDTSAERLQHLYTELRSESPAEWWSQSSAVSEQAFADVQAVLTDEQRQLWQPEF